MLNSLQVLLLVTLAVAYVAIVLLVKALDRTKAREKALEDALIDARLLLYRSGLVKLDGVMPREPWEGARLVRRPDGRHDGAVSREIGNHILASALASRMRARKGGGNG